MSIMYEYDHDSYCFKVSLDLFHLESVDYPYEPMPYQVIKKSVDRLVNELYELYKWDKYTITTIKRLQRHEPVDPVYKQEDIPELEKLLVDNAENVKRHHKQLQLVAKYLRFCPFI